MKKILCTTIVCILIPSLLFAQTPRYISNEPFVKQTNLFQVWNALNTEVGQQIVSYVETTAGSINLEQAKAFSIAKGEIAFVPIKSFSKKLASLCYRQLEDGSEYLFLITYTAAEKAVSFTFPSGQMYVMKSSGITESINPDFQFQEYDDLSNKIGINASVILDLLCYPAAVFSLIPFTTAWIVYLLIFWDTPCKWVSLGWRGSTIVCDERYIALALSLAVSFPLLYIVFAYSYPDLNLETASILFAVYFYECVGALRDDFWPGF
jgi:hypothetical protein